MYFSSLISTVHIYNNIQFHSNFIIILFLYALRPIDFFYIDNEI
jgi:hypothetical protein